MLARTTDDEAPPLSSRTASRPLAALLAAAALLASACGPDDPQTRLEDAFRRTFDAPFAYELTVEADEEALRGLPGGGAQAGAMLQSLAVSGRRVGESLELDLGFGGFPLVELRSLPDDELYVRLALDQLGAFLGGDGADPDATVVPVLRQAGVADDVVRAVRAAFRGEWVGIRGEIDSEQLQRAVGGTASPTPAPTVAEEAVREALCHDIEGFAQCYLEVQEVTEREDREVFTVHLALRDLLRAIGEAAPTGRQAEDLEADLAEVPEQVPGSVTVTDGVVTRVTVDVAEAVRGAGGDLPGTIELRLDLSDHDDVEDIAAPEDAVTITGDQLADAMAALAGLAGPAGPPGALPTPDGAVPSPDGAPTPGPTAAD